MKKDGVDELVSKIVEAGSWLKSASEAADSHHDQSVHHRVMCGRAVEEREKAAAELAGLVEQLRMAKDGDGV